MKFLDERGPVVVGCSAQTLLELIDRALVGSGAPKQNEIPSSADDLHLSSFPSVSQRERPRHCRDVFRFLSVDLLSFNCDWFWLCGTKQPSRVPSFVWKRKRGTRTRLNARFFFPFSRSLVVVLCPTGTSSLAGNGVATGNVCQWTIENASAVIKISN